MNISGIKRQCRRSWLSFQSLPAWVQIWVAAILAPANASALLMLNYWAGQVAAAAALFVVLTNVPIMLSEGGMSKLMSVPHLLAWGPLQVALLLRLAQHVGPPLLSTVEVIFTVALLVVNGVSLIFDAKDSWEWLRGDRTVPGSLR